MFKIFMLALLGSKKKLSVMPQISRERKKKRKGKTLANVRARPLPPDFFFFFLRPSPDAAVHYLHPFFFIIFASPSTSPSPARSFFTVRTSSSSAHERPAADGPPNRSSDRSQARHLRCSLSSSRAFEQAVDSTSPTINWPRTPSRRRCRFFFCHFQIDLHCTPDPSHPLFQSEPRAED
uniref:Uncharacterized protein n=1 Tax=Cucumis melo TaxID=3656 RepID=A0A9I9E5I2_CUCME